MSSFSPSLRVRAAAELELRRRKRRAESRVGYAGYLRQVIPGTWSIPHHIERIAAELDAVTRGEVDRLAIFLPPRHGKTETVTVRYPIHRLELDPGLRTLITGYNERFARRLGRKSRNIARTRLTLSDVMAADEWQLDGGGGVMTRGVGSPPTGAGFDLIIIDDPIRRREDAESAVYRDKVFDWYTDDLYTRLEPSGAIILVVTRWHHDDLAARVLASEPDRWRVISMPAISDEGAALWPERFDLEALNRTREVMMRNEGAYSWESLYQQRPTPREGAMFKVGRLRFVDACPPALPGVRAWDLASSSNGDFSAGPLLRGPDLAGVYYVCDMRHGQWTTDERNAVMLQTADMDGREVRIRLPQDPGQAGKDQALTMTRMFAGYSVHAVPVSGNKETRADPFASQVNAGNVAVVRGSWNSTFVEELRTFPMGTHDDQVDAVSDAFAELTLVGVRRWEVA